MWRWHAIEEIEHKGVAYDTWLHATRALAAVQAVEGQGQGHAARHAQLHASTGPRARSSCCGRTGLPGASAWSGCSGYMWVRPGMMRKIFSAWANFFLPGFHPWNEDDRHLIREYEASEPRCGSRTRREEGAAGAA